jgi:hypothetical protein
MDSMAKSEKKEQELVVQSAQDIIPADMLDLYTEDEGKGVSFKPEDQLIPLIYVLQSNSPVCDKRGENYIEGAEPGHFWLRNSINPIADGLEGISAIPIVMQRTWIEWLPMRQGFVARHPEPPADMINRMIRGDDGRERQISVRESNDNIIQDTREFFLKVNEQPYVLPCTGTKHSFARNWQTMFHQFRNPKTGGVLPAFARKYQLTTIPMSNASGKWFGLKFQDLGPIGKDEYLAAKAFYASVMSGEKKAEAPVAGHENAEGEGGKDKDIPF